MMRTKDIPLSQIENNTGQVNGLPANPRLVNESKLNKLIDSIRQDPEMLQLRGLLVYPISQDHYITIGGNMRLRALKRLCYATAPCIVIPKETPIEKLRNYIVKDNGEFGDWDMEALTAGWDIDELQSWCIEVPEFEPTEEERKRAGWNSEKGAKESVCDLSENIAWHPKREFSFISSYKKTETGYPLSAIKADFGNVRTFRNAAINIIKRVIGLRCTDDWAILTTPKRRHKEMNFAESVCAEIAERMHIPFYKEAITAKTKQRVNPTFTLNADIKENNLIIYDDILTTGSTLDACNKLFPDKNCLYIVGINNN